MRIREVKHNIHWGKIAENCMDIIDTLAHNIVEDVSHF